MLPPWFLSFNLEFTSEISTIKKGLSLRISRTLVRNLSPPFFEVSLNFASIFLNLISSKFIQYNRFQIFFRAGVLAHLEVSWFYVITTSLNPNLITFSRKSETKPWVSWFPSSKSSAAGIWPRRNTNAAKLNSMPNFLFLCVALICAFRVGIKVIQRNIRGWCTLRTWPWFKLYGNVKPLIAGSKKVGF